MIWLVVLLWCNIYDSLTATMFTQYLEPCKCHTISGFTTLASQVCLVLPVLHFAPSIVFFLLSLGWVGVWWWCLFMAYSIWYHCMLFDGHVYHNLLFIWSVNGHQVKWYVANNYPPLAVKKTITHRCNFFFLLFVLSIIVANLSLFLTGHSWSSPQCSCLTLGRKYNFV